MDDSNKNFLVGLQNKRFRFDGVSSKGIAHFSRRNSTSDIELLLLDSQAMAVVSSRRLPLSMFLKNIDRICEFPSSQHIELIVLANVNFNAILEKDLPPVIKGIYVGCSNKTVGIPKSHCFKQFLYKKVVAIGDLCYFLLERIDQQSAAQMEVGNPPQMGEENRCQEEVKQTKEKKLPPKKRQACKKS